MDDNWESLGRLNPERKVLIAMDMIEGCMQICADGIRQQFPGIGEEDLIEKLRARLQWAKQSC